MIIEVKFVIEVETQVLPNDFREIIGSPTKDRSIGGFRR